MAVAPRVSIVVPLFDDEEYVRAALDSCIAQTLSEIEIICVDDASTDDTVAIVEEYRLRDARVHLIRQRTNLSAFQSRRAGVEAATAPYVLFLDGDDELASHAALTAWTRAQSTGADVVGFGVEIVTPGTTNPRRFEAALQPRHDRLSGRDIIGELFPAGQEANGHIWRYLFATPLIRAAYEGIPPELTFYRANDLPITFLALAHATTYVSTPERLYRYFFRRGTSGHPVDSLDHFRFLASGVEPITAIADRVHASAERSAAPDSVLESYESARLHIIGSALRYCVRDTSGDLQAECLSLLRAQVGDLDVTRAAAGFCPQALPMLSMRAVEPTQPAAPLRSVLLTTAHLQTGGLQGVLLEHARELVDAGYRVTVAVLRDAGRDVELPTGVTLVQVSGNGIVARLDHWLEICREHAVDVIIDHHILYNENWPWFALSALAAGVPTIGWVHNFALRPIFDHSRRTSFLTTHMRVLLRVVTLSPTDVAFWKLRGLERVVYLPNPLSPLALKALDVGTPRERGDGRLELAWWGRLDPSTKQVHHLIDVAAELQAREVDFRLRLIGPDSSNLNALQVRQAAIAQGVAGSIELIGESSAEELLGNLADAHLVVLTSAIEGSPLTILEAQALGLPIAMYDLPWLTTVRGNDGLVTTPPDEPAALADAITDVARDPERYAAMSRAAREYARTAAGVDVGALVEALISDDLPADYSPDPSIEDARLLLNWAVRIAERDPAAGADGTGSARGELAAVRRERDHAVAKLRQVTEGPSFRVGRALTYFPRKVQELVRPARTGRGSSASATSTRRGAPPPPPPLRLPAGAAKPTRSVTPDVSFVIPVYNSAPWLEDCISSVLAQTGVAVEVICINDGSTDDSGAILERLAAADPRVTVIDQPNSGQSVGRNAGLEAAVGRYLVYLDSDDYWAGDALAQLVQRADDDDLDLLLFDSIAVRDGDVDDATWEWYSTYYPRARAYQQVRSGADLMVAMRRGGDYRPHVGLYLARTSFVRDIRLQFIPGIVHQDNPYTFRLLLNANRAAHASVEAYVRRIRPGSTITTLTPERSARGYYLAYLEMTRELDGHELRGSASEFVHDIVDYVYKGARTQFALISDSTADELRALDTQPDAQAVFALLSERPATDE